MHTDASTARPVYHYTRPHGWMNDPIPFYDVEWRRLHLFSICDPNSTKAPWAGGWQAWCHAWTEDMGRNWVTSRKLAVPVESPGTGSVVALPANCRARQRLHARAALFTASANAFSPQLWASADNELALWREVGAVSLPRPNITGVLSTGDVYVWHDERRSSWRLLISSLTAQGTPPMLLAYESEEDLSDWRYAGVFWTGAGANRLECPSYVTGVGMDGARRGVLTYSLPAGEYNQYWVHGAEAPNGSFVPLATGQLEWGIGYAAGMTSTWPGRALLFSWMRGVADDAATYAGAQSIPRELSMRADGTLVVRAARELSSWTSNTSTRAVRLNASSEGREHGVGRVAHHARMGLSARASGWALPATFGLTLRPTSSSLQRGPGEGVQAQDAMLSLTVVIDDEWRACARMNPRHGCAPLGDAISSKRPAHVRDDSMQQVASEGVVVGAGRNAGCHLPWSLEVHAELWLDFGLAEAFIDRGSGQELATSHSAVLSAYNQRLLLDADGLNATVWLQGSNMSTDFKISWSGVAT